MRNRYRDATLEELVWDEAFRRDVLRPTPAADRAWAAWLRQYPDQAPTVAQARQVVQALYVENAHLTEAELRDLLRTTLDQTERPFLAESERRAEAVVWPLTSQPWLRVAASVLLVLGFGYGGWWLSRPTTPLSSTTPSVARSEAAWETVRNSTRSPQLQPLPDGSTVRLQPGAELRYPARFATQQREVHLTGRAFFEVVRKADQPFLVHANGLITKVVGTTFLINADAQNPLVVVTVRSGKVSVFAASELNKIRQSRTYVPRSLLLTPNQRATFERADERLRKDLIEAPVLLAAPARPTGFTFDETPVVEVFRTLEAAYGVPIVFDAETLKHCRLTVALGDEPLFEKLDVICRTIGARYERVEAQVVVSGRGCERLFRN